MWLNPWVVMYSCRWPVLIVADVESTVDVEGRPRGYQVVCGGVLACHGKIVLCFP
jgi:hypothetical protein